MNGCQIPGTPICVDIWENIKGELGSKFFFLTHLHADHVQGLNSSWKYPIYTSPLNARLAANNLKVSKEVFKPLGLHRSYTLYANSSQYSLTVTLLDANHVPGSVMFLFQGPFGNILYSGDMRYYKELSEHEALAKLVNYRELDVLYLDNTFCSKQCDFPPRKDAIKEVLKIIREHPDCIVKVGVRNLGKEDVLEEISKATGELIGVYPTRFRQNEILDRPKVYKSTFEGTRIHCVNIPMINNKQCIKWNKHGIAICIMLSAFSYGIQKNKSSNKDHENIYVVPVSDHSSFPELYDMVKTLRPCEIRPIVVPGKNKYKSTQFQLEFAKRCDLSVFDEFLSPRRSLPSLDIDSFVVNSCPVVKQRVFRRLKRKRNQSLGVEFTSDESHDVTVISSFDQSVESSLPSDCSTPDLFDDSCDETFEDYRTSKRKDIIRKAISDTRTLINAISAGNFRQSEKIIADDMFRSLDQIL